jgi:hypothetical protein
MDNLKSVSNRLYVHNHSLENHANNFNIYKKPQWVVKEKFR